MPISRMCRDTSRPASALPILSVGPVMAGRRDGARGAAEAARGQRDIGGDADIGGGDPLGDPVIRGIRRGTDDDHLHVRKARRADRARTVGDDEHGHADTGRDAVDLLAHRAGIGVDIDGGHGGVGFPVIARSGATRQSPSMTDGDCFARNKKPRLWPSWRAAPSTSPCSPRKTWERPAGCWGKARSLRAGRPGRWQLAMTGKTSARVLDRADPAAVAYLVRQVQRHRSPTRPPSARLTRVPSVVATFTGCRRTMLSALTVAMNVLVPRTSRPATGISG